MALGMLASGTGDAHELRDDQTRHRQRSGHSDPESARQDERICSLIQAIKNMKECIQNASLEQSIQIQSTFYSALKICLEARKENSKCKGIANKRGEPNGLSENKKQYELQVEEIDAKLKKLAAIQRDYNQLCRQQQEFFDGINEWKQSCQSAKNKRINCFEKEQESGQDEKSKRCKFNTDDVS